MWCHIIYWMNFNETFHRCSPCEWEELKRLITLLSDLWTLILKSERWKGKGQGHWSQLSLRFLSTPVSVNLCLLQTCEWYEVEAYFRWCGTKSHLFPVLFSARCIHWNESSRYCHDVSTDLSLWLDSPMFRAPWPKHVHLLPVVCFQFHLEERWSIDVQTAWYLKNGWR